MKKNQKGITMISLTIVIVMMIMLTSMLIYNAKDGAYISKLKSMYNDVENLRGKIMSYYSQYGSIPTKGEYSLEGKDDLTSNWITSEELNSGKFYVIDLKALEGLTLNYGKDYEKIVGSISQDEINELTDIYIINDLTKNIFYVKGISVDGETYYSDREKDTTIVNVKYYDGIRIPDGYTYVSGSKIANLKIKNDTTNNEYVWINVNEIYSIPNDVNVKDEYEFINSVNEHKGYFKCNEEGLDENVAYVPMELDNWTNVTEAGITYTDSDGNKAYIPKGFRLNMTPNMNQVYKGLVIKDENDNEYVWINVPKEVTDVATNDEEIEKTLKLYAKDYVNDEYADVWCDVDGLTEKDEGHNTDDSNGCGLTLDDYKEEYSKMLNSIKEHGGFYISRYEAGTNNVRSSGNSSASIDTITTANGDPLSQKDKYAYNFVTCAQAQKLASKIGEGKDYNTGILFGIQWDLICKFIEETGEQTQYFLNSNSTSWGNYENAEFKLTKGKYSLNEGSTYTEVGNGQYQKDNDTIVILTTGVSNRNKTANIYDLAGNIWEWTLEKKVKNVNTDRYIIDRGGSSYNSGEEKVVSIRNDARTSTQDASGGFRITIY